MWPCFCAGTTEHRSSSKRAREETSSELSLEALTGDTARIYAAIEKLASVAVFLSVEQAADTGAAFIFLASTAVENVRASKQDGLRLHWFLSLAAP